jgi:hypothetical protein
MMQDIEMINRVKVDTGKLSRAQISHLIRPDPFEEVRRLYDAFDVGVTSLDCGKKCAPHNPKGKPFCCDICHAVPAVYLSEWSYLQKNTDLWHVWRGDECTNSGDVGQLQDETPEGMVLLACKGPAYCQRNFRALSCRQFPCFPYVTVDYRFLGLAYEWEFEDICWVISNLNRVSPKYRSRFVEFHDGLFAQRQEVFESYAVHSERMRAHYLKQHRRIPLLHRNGGHYLVSPKSGLARRVPANQLPRFGPYRPAK